VPLITVLIVTYDGRQWLPACLDALALQRGAPEFETLVVDNGSRDGSAEWMRTNYPRVRVMELGTNHGFAGGNNAGARDARGEWIAFLNNDTVADPDWLAELWRAHMTHPEFDLITSRLVFLHDPAIVDSAGDGYLRAGGAFKHGHGADAASFGVAREVFGACGGAFMINREAFDALGGFDERFFMVYEDVDLSYRARLRGMRVWYAAGAIVRHAGSGSLGSVSPASVFYGQRNLEWTWIKNTPPRLLAATAFSHAIYSIAGLAHYVRLGLGGPALRGKFAALARLPAVLRDRARVQATRTTSAADIEPFLEPRWLAAKRREKAFAGSPRVSRHEGKATDDADRTEKSGSRGLHGSHGNDS
jgi:N-acetylglucosaminyl-diphospho-decaprenol L-rhamnosyltransferase